MAAPVDANFRSGGVEGRPMAKDAWRTPPCVFDPLNAEFDFHFDAACNLANILCPTGACVENVNSLELDWKEYAKGGAVWLNPPYSNVRPWLEKAFNSGCTVVCLVPADPSVRWWNDCVAGKAAEVRFVKHRIKFLSPAGEVHETKRKGGGMTTPSAIVIYRPRFGGTTSYSYTSFK